MSTFDEFIKDRLPETQKWMDEVGKRPEYAEVERAFNAEYALAREMERVQKEAQLTQAQIAEWMGTSQGRVSCLMRGHNLSLASLTRFFDACGCEMVITAKKKQA